jgi:nicotinamide-nucleotide amidase
MEAEIIAIGDEITSGLKLDTNSQWLSLRLEAMGVRVLYHSAVGDELQPMAEVFRTAIRRSDVVVTTGGLGPTADDLTREALAAAVEQPLVLCEESLAHIRSLFARRKREMPDRNKSQAMFPKGSQAVPNPHGTAPGMAIEVPREAKQPCLFFALPGVPAEMREMWEATLAGTLAKAQGSRVVRHRSIKCFGAGESQIESMLPDLIRRGREPRVGINASKATIVLRMTAEGASEEECDAILDPVAATIRQCLGNLVFGEGDDELQHAVSRLLRQRNRSLATMEWGTAGMVAGWLGEVPNAPAQYRGGIVISDEDGLVRLAAVSPQTLARHTAISAEVARAMATRCRQQYGADYGLAVTQFPAFDPAESEPSPFFVGLAGPDRCHAKPVLYAAHPAILKTFCAKCALNVFRLAMLE